MEAPVRHDVSRSVIAAVIGAVVMAAAIAGIAFSANAGTTNSADQAAATTPPTTAPADDTDAEDAAVTTTTVVHDEAMDTEFYGDDDYEETYGEYDRCMEQSGVYELEQELFDGEEPANEEEWMAFEEEMSAAWEAADAECNVLLPEEIRIENAAWQAHSECVEEQLGGNFWNEDEWDEQAYQEADKECRSVLPQHIQDELAAYDAYESCTSEYIGEDEYYGYSDQVSYNTMDEYGSYILGDGDSEITISKVDGEVTVTVDGDVIVQDEAYWEEQDAKWMEAEANCADLMPEHEFEG